MGTKIADQLIEHDGAPTRWSPASVGCGTSSRPPAARPPAGISVGYGDDYPANLEGQYLRLGGLVAGRYVVMHRVNGAPRLRELDYRNNAASLLLRLRWRAGVPAVRVLRLPLR